MVSSSNPTQCQSSASPEFSGKVAVIDRGNCPFADKICNAQLQGATAAIVVNNVDGGVFTMGGYSGYEIFSSNFLACCLTFLQALHNIHPIGDDF